MISRLTPHKPALNLPLMIFEENIQDGLQQQGKPFPHGRRSRSAASSFDSEMRRLRSMSIEERVCEALGLAERFSWLNPVKRET